VQRMSNSNATGLEVENQPQLYETEW
jgi:hypothetical protein